MCDSSSNLNNTCVSKRMDGRRHSSSPAWTVFSQTLWLLPLLPACPLCASLFPHSVCSIIIKSELLKSTFRAFSQHWHNKVPFRTGTKIKQFWAWKEMVWDFSIFTPWEPSVEKIQCAKPSESWLAGCGSRVIPCRMSEISLPSLHSP